MPRRLLSMLLSAGLFTLGLVLATTPPGAAEPGALPGEGNWSLQAANPFVLYDAQTTVLRDGRVFIVNRGDGLTAEVYDPATDSFEVLASPAVVGDPPVRSNVVPGRPVELPDGRILLAAVTASTGWQSHVQTYDPVADAWTVLEGLPNIAVGFGPPAVALLSSGNVLVVGSAGNRLDHPGFVLDPSDGTTRTFAVDGYYMNTGVAESGGAGNAFLFGYTGGLRGAVLEVRESDLSVHVVAAHLGLTDVRTGGMLVLEDGRLALVGSADRVLTVVDPETGDATSQPLDSQPSTGAILPDGSVMVTAYYGRGHHIYEPGTGEMRFVPQTGPDGPALAATTGGATHLFIGNRVYRFVPGRFVPVAPRAVDGLKLVRCCGAGAWMSWEPAEWGDDGGYAITGHRVTRVRAGQAETFIVESGSSFHDPAGQEGDVYSVQAVNAVGPGAEVSVTATRREVPGGVRSLSATSAGRIVLTWEPPEDTGGSPIADYAVIRSDRLDTGTGYPFGGSVVTTPRFTDTTVQVGQYLDYYVVARNEDGADWISAALAGATTDSEGLRMISVVVGSPPPNQAPVTAEARRTVRSGETSGLVLSAQDPDGDVLDYEVTSGPDHGDLSGAAPFLRYTPEPGYIGPDAVTFTVDDGRGGTATGVVTLDVTAPDGASSVSQSAAAGQTVATGVASSEDEQAEVAVTTPVAGEVSITQDAAVADPEGYAVVGTQYRIEAPSASVEQPLALVFQVAADQLPAGSGPEDVTVFRDGTPIEACAGDAGWAVPDPCVAQRSLAAGVITIRVLSSHASDWALGVRMLETATTLGPIADSAYGQAMSLTAQVQQPGPAAATGTVTFRDESTTPATTLGSAPVGADGIARLTDVTLAAGSHVIVASYSGSEMSSASTSAAVPMQVAKADLVVTTKSSSTVTGALTLRMTYTTTVTSAVTNRPVAGLSVTTRVTGGSAGSGCTAVTNSSGVATCASSPVTIVLGASYTAKVAATDNYRSASATGRVPLV